jgi:hypothetical protein
MLKNKAAKHIEINSEDLFKISIKLLDVYVISPHLHSVLFICYLTVKEFSRHNQHLDNNAKIELSLKYSPDFIDSLYKSNVLKRSDADDIKNQIETKEEEVKSMLEVYAMLISYKSEELTPNKCCLG